MANRRRDRKLEARWRDDIRRQARSGLSIRAFCRQERISEPSFHGWKRELRKRDAELAYRAEAGSTQTGQNHNGSREQPIDFAPVTVVEDACRSGVERRHERGSQGRWIESCTGEIRAGEIRVDVLGGRTLHLPVSISPAWLAELVVALEFASMTGGASALDGESA